MSKKQEVLRRKNVYWLTNTDSMIDVLKTKPMYDKTRILFIPSKKSVKPDLYMKGDILYVKEAFAYAVVGDYTLILYKADGGLMHSIKNPLTNIIEIKNHKHAGYLPIKFIKQYKFTSSVMMHNEIVRFKAEILDVKLVDTPKRKGYEVTIPNTF